MRKLPTGEPCAGKPHARFGGRGRRKPFPDPYQANSANKPGFPKFTDQVQHSLYKVLQWDDAMNSFRLKSAVRFPDLSKPGKQSAKSRQLWIARHRL